MDLDCCIPMPPEFPIMPPPDPSAWLEVPDVSALLPSECEALAAAGSETGAGASGAGPLGTSGYGLGGLSGFSGGHAATNGVLVVPFVPGGDTGPGGGSSSGGGGTEFSPTFALIVSAVVVFLLTGFTAVTIILYCKRRRLKPCKSASSLTYATSPPAHALKGGGAGGSLGTRGGGGSGDPASGTHWVFNSLVLDNAHHKPGSGIPHTQSVLEVSHPRLSNNGMIPGALILHTDDPRHMLHHGPLYPGDHAANTTQGQQRGTRNPYHPSLPHHSASFSIDKVLSSPPGTPHSAHPLLFASSASATAGRGHSAATPRLALFRSLAGGPGSGGNGLSVENRGNQNQYDRTASPADQYHSLSMQGPIYEEINSSCAYAAAGNSIDMSRTEVISAEDARLYDYGPFHNATGSHHHRQNYANEAPAGHHDYCGVDTAAAEVDSDSSSCSNMSLLPSDDQHSPSQTHDRTQNSSSDFEDHHHGQRSRHPHRSRHRQPPPASMPPLLLSPPLPQQCENCGGGAGDSSGGRESGYSTQGGLGGSRLNNHSLSTGSSYDSPPMPHTNRFSNATGPPPVSTATSSCHYPSGGVKLRGGPSAIKTNPLMAYNRGSRHLTPTGEFV